MDLLWMVLGGVLMVVGLAGCILPFLPGPPLCYLALLLQQVREVPPFSSSFLIAWLIVTVVVTVLDYVIPLYGTRKFGGSRYGIWGCTIGLFVGLWFGPVGIILGPFIGAFVGEMLATNNSGLAFKAALGSFAGFLFGTLLKLVVCLVMGWYFLTTLW